jgi:hypothetical protein
VPIIQEFKKNLNLEWLNFVSCSTGETDLTKIQRDRNKYGRQTAENPNTVPTSHWPFILESAHGYEYHNDIVSTVLKTLMTKMGEEMS